MRQVEITQQRLITPQIRNITPTNSGQQITKAVTNFAQKVGGQLIKQAEKNYQLRIDREMKTEISRIERENLGQPEKMQEALNNYHDVLIESVPLPAMEAQVSSAFGVQSAPSLNRAYATKRKVIDEETEEEILLHLNSSQETMLNIAPDIFSDDEEVATTAAQKIQRNMLDIQASLDATKSDGSPLFTGAQRVSKTLAARDAMFQTAAFTWVSQQPNKVAAYQQWKNGEVKISFPDEDGKVKKINIRDTIPPTVRKKIDNDFIKLIKDEINIQNTIEQQEERKFRQDSDLISSEILVKLQDGQDVFQEVESLKNKLEPDTYVDLRKMAIEEEPLNNQAIYGDLLRRAYDGEDVVAEAKVARFIDKRLDNSSYTELVKISQGGTSGIQDPVNTGRKYVIESLGSLSTLLPLTNSKVIANAKRNYDEVIERFRQENERFPTQTEAFELADEIIPRWQAIETNDQARTLAKPIFMTEQEKIKANKSLSRERLEEIRGKTDDYFINKYQGNIDAIAQDPEYQREMGYIDSFEEIVNNRLTQ